jgi:hypothetical protein
MELASLLAGERFGDRPASACPIIGSILRTYNDVVDDERRFDLYRYAAESVGTRGDFDLQHRRAAIALSWARPGYETRRRRWVGLRNCPTVPDPDSGPDGIAEYVVGSLHRRQSDSAHGAMMWLLDKLIDLPPGPCMDELTAPDPHSAETWLELPAPPPPERTDEWVEIPVTPPPEAPVPALRRA